MENSTRKSASSREMAEIGFDGFPADADDLESSAAGASRDRRAERDFRPILIL
jgi:hypothetical protein